MSRYEFRGREPHFSVIVGWDRSLQTYFAQVWDGRLKGVGEENGEEPVLWVGCWGRELPTVDMLVAAVTPFADLPSNICAQLRKDKGRESVAAK